MLGVPVASLFSSSSSSSSSSPFRIATDVEALSFDEIDGRLRNVEKMNFFFDEMPWKIGRKEDTLGVVFQQGKVFIGIMNAYNKAIEDGKGRKSLKSNKDDHTFVDLSQMSILDYLPDTIARFIEGFIPVKKKSRLETASATVTELEDAHRYTTWKYKPSRNLAFSLDSPDSHFCADRYVNLRNGETAFKIVEPEIMRPNGRVIVCLHGLLDSSYIWTDIAELLAHHEDGPKARVLFFDFYGHGRSPWTGVANSLDVLVSQTKELLEGAAVGVGFAAKYPELCSSLTLISPVGIKTSFLKEYKVLLRRYCVGEMVIRARSTVLAENQRSHYFNDSDRSIHWPLLQKQMAMVRFQLSSTPGYLGALLSTYREFPFRLEELLSVVGLHSRPVLIIWGDRDIICPYKTSIHKIEPCFPNAYIVDVQNCGHNPIFEKYNDVASELIDFYARHQVQMR